MANVKRSVFSLAGEKGAHRLHSLYDPRETTQKARDAFMRKFEVEVDPNNELPEAERRRRAEHARKAYFADLTLKSVQARKARAKGGADAA